MSEETKTEHNTSYNALYHYSQLEEITGPSPTNDDAKVKTVVNSSSEDFHTYNTLGEFKDSSHRRTNTLKPSSEYKQLNRSGSTKDELRYLYALFKRIRNGINSETKVDFNVSKDILFNTLYNHILHVKYECYDEKKETFNIIIKQAEYIGDHINYNYIHVEHQSITLLTKKIIKQLTDNCFSWQDTTGKYDYYLAEIDVGVNDSTSLDLDMISNKINMTLMYPSKGK